MNAVLDGISLPLNGGLYEFGPGSLTSRDPFGLFPQEAEAVLEPCRLVVLPKIVPLVGAEALDRLFGTRRREGWIFTETHCTKPVRGLSEGDSARKINWKASARHLSCRWTSKNLLSMKS